MFLKIKTINLNNLLKVFYIIVTHNVIICTLLHTDSHYNHNSTVNKTHNNRTHPNHVHHSLKVSTHQMTPEYSKSFENFTANKKLQIEQEIWNLFQVKADFPTKKHSSSTHKGDPLHRSFHKSSHETAILRHLRYANSKCINPSDADLTSLLSEYDIIFRQHRENITKLIRSRVSTAKINNYNHLVDNSMCNLNDRASININERSMCPWKIVNTYVPDRFPHIKSEVKCSCDKCVKIGNEFMPTLDYGCMPVLHTLAVLVKGDCLSNGFFEWLPSLEEVSVACTCAYTYELYSN